VYAALHAGHTVADYWGQSDFQAQVKGKPGADGQLACAATGERLSARRLMLGLAVNAASHYAIDRRDHGVMPHLCKLLRRYGKEDFARAGTGLATGAALLDQAWHIGWCFATAAIIAGRNRP
jgi:hypothetical protein